MPVSPSPSSAWSTASGTTSAAAGAGAGAASTPPLGSTLPPAPGNLNRPSSLSQPPNPFISSAPPASINSTPTNNTTSPSSSSSASAPSAPHHPHHNQPSHYNHNYTTTDPSALSASSSSSSRLPFSSSSTTSPSPAYFSQTGANHHPHLQQQQQQSSTAFAPQGSAFSSFLSPAASLAHRENTIGRQESSSAVGTPLTRPRAGTLPSSIFSPDDAFHLIPELSGAFSSALGYNETSDGRFGGGLSGSTVGTPTARQQTYYSSNNSGAGAAQAPPPPLTGSSSASLSSTSTFPLFHPFIGSLSASASRPGSSSGPTPFGL
ncbi:hypothetical protein CF326_g9929, partial [Tilletia indica]